MDTNYRNSKFLTERLTKKFNNDRKRKVIIEATVRHTKRISLSLFSLSLFSLSLPLPSLSRRREYLTGEREKERGREGKREKERDVVSPFDC